MDAWPAGPLFVFSQLMRHGVVALDARDPSQTKAASWLACCGLAHLAVAAVNESESILYVAADPELLPRITNG